MDKLMIAGDWHAIEQSCTTAGSAVRWTRGVSSSSSSGAVSRPRDAVLALDCKLGVMVWDNHKGCSRFDGCRR